MVASRTMWAGATGSKLSGLMLGTFGVAAFACTPDWTTSRRDAGSEQEGGDDEGGDEAGADTGADALELLDASMDAASTCSTGCLTDPCDACSPGLAEAALPGNEAGLPSDEAGNPPADPCEPNPCASGFTCSGAPGATAVCAAPCATSAANCQPGDTCATDADCRKGSEHAACDAQAKVCVTRCATTTILTQATLEAARYCREIEGDLIVEPDFSAIRPEDLRFLVTITGDLHAASNPAMPVPSVLETFTLPALTSIGGDVRFGPLSRLQFVSLPRLERVDGVVTFGFAPLERIALPSLTTVKGALSLTSGLTSLVQLDVRKLMEVGGVLSVIGLCNLPWSQVEPISTLGLSQAVFNIGCCTSLSAYACSGNTCDCN